MADRELFVWKGAAIMGDEGRPKYARVDPEFVGSPVWGVNGAIAALLARVAEVEAERDAALARAAAAEARVAEAKRLLAGIVAHEDKAVQDLRDMDLPLEGELAWMPSVRAFFAAPESEAP